AVAIANLPDSPTEGYSDNPGRGDIPVSEDQPRKKAASVALSLEIFPTWHSQIMRTCQSNAINCAMLSLSRFLFRSSLGHPQYSNRDFGTRVILQFVSAC